MPRVSILMTVYNARKYIEQAISSIINQSVTDWELIIIDDGSIDDSQSIINSFSDARIISYFLPENIGRINALNQACQKATGEFVAILDADDVAEENRLQVQLEFMDRNKDVGVVSAWAKFIDESGSIISYYRPPAFPSYVNELLSSEMVIVHSTMLIRRSILVDEFHYYSSEFKIGHDWELCVRVAHKYRICIIGEVLGSWRRYSASLTGSRENFLKGRIENFKILEKARSLAQTTDSKTKSRRKIAITLLAISYYYFLDLKLVIGWQYFWQAISTDISCLVLNQKIRNLLGQNIPYVCSD